MQNIALWSILQFTSQEGPSVKLCFLVYLAVYKPGNTKGKALFFGVSCSLQAREHQV